MFNQVKFVQSVNINMLRNRSIFVSGLILFIISSGYKEIITNKTDTTIKAQYHLSLGNVVAIQHKDGINSLYAHQQEYQVKVDDTVKQGKVIGYVGATINNKGHHFLDLNDLFF